MKDQDLTVTITVDKSPKEAFDAINNVRGWWSEEVKGGTEQLNDEFTYKARDLHRCSMKLIEVIPNQKVVWLVLDNYFSFTEDQTEWKGTKVVFEISEQDGKTKIRFTHQGLVPQHECYEVCSNAWTGYITGSLYKLITTGKGEPNPKES
ncbi:SRPBCC domain-containing protein [Mucilaginibacter sp. Mucisp86]|uniref:SRPBCC family protein n=1 Tax=Mucilaginibacter sp. Mucisp86 TaxID=3243060 RepID=UPI0039B61872